MLRFTMPETAISPHQKAEALYTQLEEFLCMEALLKLLKILEVDTDTIGQVYNGRLRGKDNVVETLEMKPLDSLEEKREVLYPLFRELGFIDINQPKRDKNQHIIVLGGSLNACKERTECAKVWVDETTRFVDGFACFRPLGITERRSAELRCETEFGAMSECFANTFGLERTGYSESFQGNRNLNSISCIRSYEKAGNCAYRIYAAPSGEPGIRRADTGDTFRFYMDTGEPAGPEDSFLFITNNRYCNRQFLQLAYWMIEYKYPGTIDVIGCYPDGKLVSAERYDPFQYIQDLIGMIDWARRFRKLLNEKSA